MFKILCFFVSSFFFLIHAQDKINFKTSLPEDSKFSVIQESSNIGTMIITGTEQELNALKKSGYNTNRKLNYHMSYFSKFNTNKKNGAKIPFEFYFDEIAIDVDSDGKTQNVNYDFSDVILNGVYENNKFNITNSSQTGFKEKDDFINNLPIYFSLEFPTVDNMKIGDFFIVERNANELSNSMKFSANGKLTYTLNKIDSQNAYFEVTIQYNSNKKSELALSGLGKGEMIYNYLQNYIEKENLKIDFHSEMDEKTYKIVTKNILTTSYELKN